MARTRRSRLARKEETKNLRRAYFFSGLTIVLILAILFIGIPFLIRLASFLGELKSAGQLIESNDTTAPLPPQIYPLPKATNESKIAIEGKSEPDSKITIYINGLKTKDTLTDKEGIFNVQLSLGGQNNEISAEAEDQSGNRSGESEKITIIFDQIPPEISLLTPDQEIFSTDERQIIISGQTEPEASIFINERMIIVGQEGVFNYTFNLNEGENIIILKAQDSAGNETEKELKITYEPF